ncbi:MAG TPA: hypothetical protein VFF68_04220, partial [Anaerolineaceae bacterium]|nr:hypothetical protein [Anaerolineaceae bacterium]
TAGAVLTGIGVGLFIDEVGKFITQTNDYFYPLAAPIVYAFFLLSTLLYVRINRRRDRSVRRELYSAFEAMEEVLEQDLDPNERAKLEESLRFVSENSRNPALVHLANELQDFLTSETLRLVEPREPFVVRMHARWRRFESRWLTRQRVKVFLSLSFLLLGLTAAVEAAVLLVSIPEASSGTWAAVFNALRDLFRTEVGGETTVIRLIELALETSVGLMLVLASGLLASGRDKLGTALGYLGLLFSLTAVNLLVFYFNQFSAILAALIQLGLLIVIAYYRQKYLVATPP